MSAVVTGINSVLVLSLIWITILVSTVICWTERMQSLERILSHFDTLHHAHLRHHVTKRHVDSQKAQERRVEYDTLGKHFQLVLKHDRSVLAPDFKTVAIDRNGRQRILDNIDIDMYHGYLADDPSTSTVSAYFDDEDTLTATISTAHEVYVVEPSWRHLPNSSNYTMISYKGSDLHIDKDLGKKFCQSMNADVLSNEGGVVEGKGGEDVLLNEGGKERGKGDEIEIEMEGMEETDELRNIKVESGSLDAKGRVRRAASPVTCKVKDKVCHLLLVADYRFFKEIGYSDITATRRYLIDTIDFVDHYFKRHTFGKDCQSMGFTIKEIRIHVESSNDSNRILQFNNDLHTEWDQQYSQLLFNFSRDSSFKQFCLAHLFTAIPFKSGVLGLAYVASSNIDSSGGICSNPYFNTTSKETSYRNTGWSSVLNRSQRKLLTMEAKLVTAHEFGHNWGSQHDPNATTSECTPAASAGGKYLMYPNMVSGFDINNRRFSQCSLDTIGAVLASKAEHCFIARPKGECGNSNVESAHDEQCDAGLAPGGMDQCCGSDCKLKSSAICSDSNSECCTNCNYSLPTKVCYTFNELFCLEQSSCTGNSSACPTPRPRLDGIKCHNSSGTCRSGECLSLCEFNNLTSCINDDVELSCTWCCKQLTGDTSCLPFNKDVNMYLPDGTPCVQGYCDQGKCIKQVQDLSQRIWKIIQNISVDEFVMFMRANIVGTVIVLSLIIWIPASCIVAAIDRKRTKEAREYDDWKNPGNSQLYTDEDKHLILEKPVPRRRKLPTKM